MKKIALIEDDKDILDIVALILAGYDYEITTVPKANNIVDWLAKTQPHLVLLDLHLSGIDGRDICKAIKKNAATKNSR